MKTLLLFFISFISISLVAQPSTEVYLFDLKEVNGAYSLSNPINISDNEGYDNQPNFVPDGSGVLFSSTYEDQTEVVKYDITSKKKIRLTYSEGSEYSPTVTPDGQFFSTIILEKDGRQLLWKYTIDGREPTVVVPDLKIGYHCWVDAKTLVSFVLGEPATLQLSKLNEGSNQILDKEIGRSLHKIPGKKLISYISKKDKEWIIKSLDPVSGNSKKLVKTLPQKEDMAWSTNGTIFMGDGNKLFQFNEAHNTNWQEVADLSSYQLSNISRISVSPKGNKIAIVVED